jgi:hypothetical protein
MNYDWYLLFNQTEFMATELVSRTIKVSLEGLGEKDILIIRSNDISIVYADVMLPVEFNGENPFVREGDEGTYAVYKDDDENVWLGILQS